MEGVMKIINFYVDSGLMTKEVTQIIQNEKIKQGNEFFKLVIVYLNLDGSLNGVTSFD